MISSKLGLPLILLPSLLCAGPAPGGDLVLRVNELPNTQNEDPLCRLYRALIDKFLAEHSGIRLESATGLGQTGLQIQGAAANSVVLMQIAGDIAPDVLSVGYGESEAFIRKGFLRPLDQFIAEMDPEELARRVPPAVRAVCRRKGPDGRMHWYAFPIQNQVSGVLIYRRDVLARAGLDPDRPPRTWEELRKYVRHLRRPSGDPTQDIYGFVFGKGDMSAADLQHLVTARGGDITIRDEQGNWHPSFNSPEVLDALQFYVSLVCPRWTDSTGRPRRGYVLRENGFDVMWRPNVAMGFYHMNRIGQVYPMEKVGWAASPHPADHGPGRPQVGASLLGIYAGCKDPSLVRAAWDWIALQDSEFAHETRTTAYVQYGWGRFADPESLARYGYDNYLDKIDEDWTRTFREAMERGKPGYYGENASVIGRELSKAIEQAVNDAGVLAAVDAGDDAALRNRLSGILDSAQKDAEERLFGILPPSVASFRHKLSIIFLCLATLGFGLATIYLIRVFRRSAPSQTPGQKRNLIAYMLLLPATGSILVWQYYPLLKGAIIAFQDYNVMGGSRFVGVSNFAEILFDHTFWHSVYVTVLYTVLYMCLAFIAPIVLALMLSEVPRGKVIFRTLYYLPAVLSGLVVMFLWRSFYRVNGLLNTILGLVGIEIGAGWLDTPRLAMLAILLPVIWAGMGPGSLIYMAALKTIPEELYEAAEVDGAGILTKVRRITLPGLKMLILINAIGAFAGAFMSSELILAMTGGGPYTPYGATEVVGLQLFYTAFLYLKFGVANAMAWVLGFILLGFTMLQLKNLSKVEFKGGR